MAIRRIELCFLFLLISTLLTAQSREELERQKRQKQKEIEFTQKLLDETSEKQRKNINYVYILNRQIKNRVQLIKTEEKVLSMLNESISESRTFIEALENDVKSLQKEYQEMLYFAYKNRGEFDYLLYLFASESLQQVWNRMRYIRYYAQIRENQIGLIKATQESLKGKILNLEETIVEKELLLNNLEKERVKLIKDRAAKRQLVDGFKEKEEEYREKLKEDRKRARELDEAIEEIINAEIAKDENIEISGLGSTEFASNRAQFIWPANGVVSKAFGRQAHPTIPDVYVNNNGVDIRTTKGAPVRAVFPGSVIHVVFIPGADNAIIIKHGDYYTVYKNLVEVQVAPGDNVTEGQLIGKVAFNENKEISELHFEVRHQTQKLDPALWLKKK